MTCRFVLLLALSLILTTGSICPAADLPEALKQLQNWQERIRTIRIKTRVTSTLETNGFLRKYQPEVREQVLEYDGIWERNGYTRSDYRLFSDGEIRLRDLRIGHSNKITMANFSRDNPLSEVATEVTFTGGVLGLGGPAADLLWDGMIQDWFGSHLAEHTKPGRATVTVTPEGYLQVDERISNSHIPAGSRLILDPQHGYLPLSTEWIPDNQPNTGSLRTVDEFREIEPGFWFPVKGTNTGRSAEDEFNHQEHWEVTQLDLNEVFPLDLFKAPIGIGTAVNNQIAGERYVMTEKGKEMVPDPAPPPLDRPRGGAFANLVLGWRMPLIVLFTGFILLWSWKRGRVVVQADERVADKGLDR